MDHGGFDFQRWQKKKKKLSLYWIVLAIETFCYKNEFVQTHAFFFHLKRSWFFYVDNVTMLFAQYCFFTSRNRHVWPFSTSGCFCTRTSMYRKTCVGLEAGGTETISLRSAEKSFEHMHPHSIFPRVHATKQFFNVGSYCQVPWNLNGCREAVPVPPLDTRPQIYWSTAAVVFLTLSGWKKYFQPRIQPRLSRTIFFLRGQ